MKKYRLKKINPRTWEVYKGEIFVGIVCKELVNNRTKWKIDNSKTMYSSKSVAAEELLLRRG